MPTTNASTTTTEKGGEMETVLFLFSFWFLFSRECTLRSEKKGEQEEAMGAEAWRWVGAEAWRWVLWCSVLTPLFLLYYQQTKCTFGSKKADEVLLSFSKKQLRAVNRPSVKCKYSFKVSTGHLVRV
jgi:hypothetical protein